MKAVRLHIAGAFEDAFVYMGRLLLLTGEGSIQAISMASTLDQVARGRARKALGVLFERNDRMHAKGLIRAAGSAVGSNRELTRLASEAIAVKPVVEAEIKLGIDYTVPLDLLTYYRRVYIATDRGLFSQDLDFDAPSTRGVGSPQRRTEPSCLAVTARYGTVNASCEDDGLFQSVDEFGWLGGADSRVMSKTAQRSRRTSWLNQGFVNYSDGGTLSLFETKTIPVPQKGGDEHEGRAIQSVHESDSAGRSLRERLEAAELSPRDAIHVWSSLSGLFVQAHDGLFYLKFTNDSEEMDPSSPETERQAIRLGGGFSSVLSARTFGRGTVVETDDSVIAFENQQTHVLVEKPAISVRSFPSSRWYRRVIAVVLEDEVLVTSVVRDYMFELED